MKQRRTNPALRAAIGRATAIAALVAVSATASAQATLQGRVIDTADTRLAAATVEFVGVTSTVTDTNGVYRVTGLAPQTFIVRVRKIGYAPVTRIVSVGTSETRREDFELLPSTVVLKEVVTTATASSPRSDPSGFLRRREHSVGGNFITEAQVAESRVIQTEDLFLRFGYMRVGSGGIIGGPVVGASGSPLPPPRRGPPRAQAGTGSAPSDGKCRNAAVFVDGTLVGEDFDVNTVPPAAIRGIEMYRGPATTPPELRSYATTCGTVAIWTK